MPAPAPVRRTLPALCALLALALVPAAARALPLRWSEEDSTRRARMVTPGGTPLAEGTFEQRYEEGRLHVRAAYRFGDGRQVEEVAVFRLAPELVQEGWAWSERRGEEVSRRYEVDFATGRATGLKRRGEKTQRWSETLEVTPGRTFAGLGFALAAKNLHSRLAGGERVELHALAFTPKPRRVRVTLSQPGARAGERAARVGGVDRVVIHPEIGIAAWLVDAPDTELFLQGGEPPQLVAGQGPLLEPGDPVVRTEVLAAPQATAATRHPLPRL